MCYGEELAEAAAALVALSWKAIIDDGLQDTFANKFKMRAYLRVPPKPSAATLHVRSHDAESNDRKVKGIVKGPYVENRSHPQ